ncbi:MAG: hypothetical protein J0L70_02715 [Leptolyngbya sp. UWPOB_LEPTO1]|uniref:hypothetical protein n=1 Tax=Leptolyngbya sp. UWPOB_LEPTO1 TaxID=2815653 RepID=UPI001AC63A0D|nr:hypothetical protein [Leptolyngbya sp. UWPOB_LEPTO1]MBN8559416.1 hypothetical protein [Leptolyngbya sp. UWPOB_LEPTO1]
MLSRLRRIIRQFFTRTRTINKQPLNPASLIVLILIDIFILVNVFTGLNDISNWVLSPTQANPCYTAWQNYRESKDKNKDFNIVRAAADKDFYPPISSFPPNSANQTLQDSYRQNSRGQLGDVSPTCQGFATAADKVNTPDNEKLVKSIAQKQDAIAKLENSNRNIRAQYDSTLLEKIAGQNREQSINNVGAEKAKQQLDNNNQQIAQLRQEIEKLKADLLAKPESTAFLKLLNDGNTFSEVERSYKHASFWYPSIQLTLQALFLVPLLIGAAIVNRFAERKRYGLVALISWHLLIIFFIPLILKVFEFLQVGVLFKVLFDLISTIFGGLVFLVSYAYILIIPIAGFALIKLFQTIVKKSKPQPSILVQQSRCLNCTRVLKGGEDYCPHCGYHQHHECHNCHQPTYQHLPYCRNCGAEQNPSESI